MFFNLYETKDIADIYWQDDSKISRIEINTIEELYDFCVNNGGMIIISSIKQSGVNPPSIEIYNDWRE